MINKAYKTLQSPLERGEYLLRLHGVTLPEDNTISDPEFLMEMMERNEEVKEAFSQWLETNKLIYFRLKTPTPKTI